MCPGISAEIPIGPASLAAGFPSKKYQALEKEIL
jgi:hypothetical protein